MYADQILPRAINLALRGREFAGPRAGAVWDPATAYSNAVTVAQMLPNSRLISSDNWGHTSLGTGACVDNDTFAYLVNPTAPAPKITLCTGDVQPFASSSSAR